MLCKMNNHFLKKKYSWDKKRDQIYHSRLNQLPDELYREIYRRVFKNCLRTINRLDTVLTVEAPEAYFCPLIKPRIVFVWTNYPDGTGWGLLWHHEGYDHVD